MYIFQKLRQVFSTRIITRMDDKLNYLQGYCTKTQKLACFVLYLKIINIFWKMIYASYSKLFKKLKNSIKINVG